MLLVLLLVLLSCTSSAPKPNKSGPPQRIISVVPSVTEMLFAFGLGDKVIGVSDFDHVPPEVETRTRVGGLINPDIEKIITMRPDLVITYGTQDELRRHLESAGIPIFPYVHGNVEQTLKFMLDLGHAAGAEDRARQTVEELRRTFQQVRARAPAAAPKVLLIYGREAGTMGSFYSVGPRAFQHDLIEMAGGRSLFDDVDQETVQPTLEEVINRKPDIIVETLSPPLKPSEVQQRENDWNRLELAKGRIYIEGESYFLIPGPALGMAAERMSQIIRGER
jgi:cobalamin transport system substrate-binding protein